MLNITLGHPWVKWASLQSTVRSFLLILHRLIVEQNLHLKLNVML